MSPATAAIGGLVLTSAQSITLQLQVLVTSVVQVEQNMNSIERTREYRALPSEYEEKEGDKCLPKWPQKGEIVVKELNVAYGPERPLVLQNICFQVKGGEKIGICGKSGSGKSTLLNCFCRLLDFRGDIEIDGQNIANLSLQALRSKLTILPQESVVFSQTLRFNLDPLDQSSDDELWRVIRQAHLTSFAHTLSSGLDTELHADMLSAGAKQLLALARALLRHSRILLVDEATSSLDPKTDQIIQQSIREHFQDSTILTIAHRIDTILDYDQILVLDKGRVVEYDTPANLLSTPDSLFSQLAQTIE